MSAGLAGLITHPVLVVLGWSAVLVLWETAVLALVYGAWRVARSDRAAHAQYRAALAALVLAAALALVTPVVLAVAPLQETGRVTSAGRVIGNVPVGGPGGTAGWAARLRDAPGAGQRVAGWAAVAWLAGAGVLAVRLFGGWWTASRIRRASRPVVGTMTLGTSFGEPGSPHPVELLQSDAVEAPVVVGWKHPAIILPTGALAQLQPAAVDALLAHELAHVARGDYGANLVQSILEVLLFFSPPARWLSARVREAREFCCDDAAVAQCGGAERYAKALAAVAALGSSHRRLALGAAGPRLIVRIRRLLREDAMTKYAGLRIGAIGAALAAVLWTGSIVTAASLERTAAAWRQSGTAGSGPGGIPVGFVPSQPGAALTIEAVTSTTDALCGALTVRNPTDVDVIGLTVAAVVEQRGAPNASHVQIFTRESDAPIPAGGTAVVQVDLLSPGEVGAVLPGPVQVMCALSSVRFANGWSWQVTPNPAVSRADAALSLPPAEVDASLVGPPPTTPSAPGQAAPCRDEQGRPSSEGAVMPVRGRPGRLARCAGGQWVELVSERPPAAAPVTSPPVPIKQVRPDARVALAVGQQGTVLVAITVDRNGGVSAARVVKSLSPELDAEALRAARQWTFIPGRRDGQPVAAETQLEMTFTLR